MPAACLHWPRVSCREKLRKLRKTSVPPLDALSRSSNVRQTFVKRSSKISENRNLTKFDNNHSEF